MPFKKLRMTHFRTNFSHDVILGKGASGEVHRCLNRIDSQFYAIKMIKFKHNTNLVLNEVKVLSTLNHQNIVRYFNSWVENQKGQKILFIQMESTELSLRQLLDKQTHKLQHKQTILILKDISQALQYIHDSGFVHCDLCPQNILLKSTQIGYQALISDFGQVVKRCDTQQMVKNIDFVIPLHLPPEYTYSQTHSSIDIFSFGVLMLEMLCFFQSVMEKSIVLDNFKKQILPINLLNEDSEFLLKLGGNFEDRPLAFEVKNWLTRRLKSKQRTKSLTNQKRFNHQRSLSEVMAYNLHEAQLIFKKTIMEDFL